MGIGDFEKALMEGRADNQDGVPLMSHLAPKQVVELPNIEGKKPEPKKEKK
jgi:hypothetical protein